MPQKPAKDDIHESRLILARNVRRRRNALKLTLAAASERVHLHWRHWQKIEAGDVNVTLDTLVRVAGALGVELHVLLLPSALDPSAEQRAAKLVDEFLATLGMRDKLLQLVARKIVIP